MATTVNKIKHGFGISRYRIGIISNKTLKDRKYKVVQHQAIAALTKYINGLNNLTVGFKKKNLQYGKFGLAF